LDGKGTLYGTTEYGGNYGYYGGTVFKLTPSGTETVLHSFNPGDSTDGVGPYAGLVRDAKGNLYGTTYGGGAYGSGTIFEVTRKGKQTILYSFNPGNGTDGANPEGALVLDKKTGDLYGTTFRGGAYGSGTVFELTPSSAETVLYSFNPGNGTDAENPYAGLVMDKKGNLYGTSGGGAYKYGAVFEVTPSGTETVLYSFNGGNGTDGYAPFGGLVLDRKGNLYGTTKYGGGPLICGSLGCGTVFKVTPSGDETILYRFGARSGDAIYPFAGLVRDKNGNLYGTTLAGGAQGNGVVFKLTPSGAETILYSFNPGNGTDGYQAYGGLAIDKGGNLYGTTEVGGAHGYGTVYKVTQ
jgi:uncharacterized repeat protein (TIGR03803 family)